MPHLFANPAGRRPAVLGLIPVALATGALVAACGSSSSPTATPPPAATTSAAAAASTSVAPAVETPATTAAATAAAAAGEAVIHIKDFMYTDPTTPIKAGAKFLVINDDSVAHTYEDVNGKFDSGTVKPGSTVTVTAPAAGTYKVKCDFHPNMHGTLVVS